MRIVLCSLRMLELKVSIVRFASTKDACFSFAAYVPIIMRPSPPSASADAGVYLRQINFHRIIKRDDYLIIYSRQEQEKLEYILKIYRIIITLLANERTEISFMPVISLNKLHTCFYRKVMH